MKEIAFNDVTIRVEVDFSIAPFETDLLRIYHQQIKPGSRTPQFETMNNYLFYSIKGSGEVFTPFISYSFRDRQAFFVDANAKFYIEAHPHQDVQYMLVEFIYRSPDFPFLSAYKGIKPLGEIEPRILSCLDLIAGEINHLSQYSGIIKESLLEVTLLYMFNELAQESIPQKGEITHLSSATLSALYYIHQNYAQKISLNDLAEHVGIPVRTLSGYFKREMRQSPVAYLNDLRLKTAHLLIERSQISIQEAAKSVGFANADHFSKIFKQKYRYTPKQLQNKSK